MVRLKQIEVSKSLNCVKSLIKGNIPLCVVDINESNSMELLKEIAFKADLFIAVENVSTIEQAYLSAGNGAQFFILNSCSEDLMQELTSNGFFYIPRVKTPEDIEVCTKLNIECYIDNNGIISSSTTRNIFSIIDLPKNVSNYEKWINGEVKTMLGLNYTEIIVRDDLTESEKMFVETFASTQKCIVNTGDDNALVLECNNIDAAVSYFKWRDIFIDPDKSVVVNDRVIQSPLDKKLNGFTIILKEKDVI